MNLNYQNLLPYLCLLLFAVIGCEKSPVEPPVIAPSEFTKQDRENLGDNIQIAIAFDNDRYPVLPNIPPYDTTVYWFVQKLYDQATNHMRIDNQSSSDNRWNIDRNWRVTILKLEEKNMFVLPGGHLYITTGLLKALQSDHELYYMLAFEANLMNEKYLLNQLINDFNTNELIAVANNDVSPNGTTRTTLAQIINQIEFKQSVIQELDEHTARTICETSIMDRAGIIRLLDGVDDSWVWMTYRPTYGGRAALILSGIDMGEVTCGDFTSSGGYQRFVLEHIH